MDEIDIKEEPLQADSVSEFYNKPFLQTQCAWDKYHVFLI